MTAPDESLGQRVAATMDDEWRQALGRWWWALLVLFGVSLFVAGATLPLSDPDFPIHLATGEWVVRHRAVPFVEPWAWTRPGEPFQAYSWAIEALYFLVLRSVGPLGLHAMHGLVFVALAAAMFALGRVARWNPWTTIIMAAGNLVIALGATPYLRPQAILLIVTPLIWALVFYARDADRGWWCYAALFIASAVVANTHLLIPLTAAPCVLLLMRPVRPAKFIGIPLAIVAGWFLTPYAAHWIDIYKLNFARNTLFGPPSPIGEYQPGFSTAAEFSASGHLVAFAFLLVPWVVAQRFSPRERVLYGVLWFGGAVLFALAVRALIVWWLVILIPVGTALQLLPAPTLPLLRAAQRGVFVAIALAVSLIGVEAARDPWLDAGTVDTRVLPTVNARMIEPLAHWLDCEMRPEARGRLVTVFNYGGYVPWRLPRLSESIDGRTIFPDSVAAAETFTPPNRRDRPLQPWRTADLAIAPQNWPIAGVLDTAAGWRKVAVPGQLEGKARSIGLWVTERWWQTAGRRPLPTSVLPLFQRPPRDLRECTL
jgi:hypothetical protein